MVRLYGLLFLAEIFLCVIALIDCLSSDEGEIRALSRVYWVLIILFFPIVGSIAWFAAGRPMRSTPRPGQWRQGRGFPEYDRPRSPAPDDDPEFRAGRMRREDEEMFSRWEADLRRREEKLKRPDDGSAPEDR